MADAVEALQRIAPRRPVSSYRQSATAARLAEARSCYDHLAGRLALRLADALVAEGAIAPLEAGANGRILLAASDAGSLAARLRVGEVGPDGRRPAVRGCLDWTERRPHVAGRLGAHLLDAVLDEGWVSRVPGDRSLRVTEAGAPRSRRSPDRSPRCARPPRRRRRPRHRGSDRDAARSCAGAPCTSRCSRSMRASSSAAVCAASVSPSSSSWGTCRSYL